MPTLCVKFPTVAGLVDWTEQVRAEGLLPAELGVVQLRSADTGDPVAGIYELSGVDEDVDSFVLPPTRTEIP